MHLKMSSAKRHPVCLGGDELWLQRINELIFKSRTQPQIGLSVAAVLGYQGFRLRLTSDPIVLIQIVFIFQFIKWHSI